MGYFRRKWPRGGNGIRSVAAVAIFAAIVQVARAHEPAETVGVCGAAPWSSALLAHADLSAHSFAIVIIVLSMAFQLAAAFTALRLMRLTGRRVAWVLLTAVLLLMAARRGTALYAAVDDPHLNPPQLLQESIALVISVLLLLGMLAIRPVLAELSERAHRALESEARLAAAFDNLPFDIWVCDRDGRLVYQNPSFVGNAGHFIGRHLAEIPMPEPRRNEWVEQCRRALDGEHITLDCDVVSRGQVQSLRRMISPVRLHGDVRGIAGMDIDMTPVRRIDRILRRLTEATAATGEEFFRALAQSLCQTLGVKCALVGELDEASRGVVRTLGFCLDGSMQNATAYDLRHTPCEAVVTGARRTCFHRSGVADLFPNDQMLIDMGADSYLGTPLLDSAGEAIGILTVVHDGKIDESLDPQMVMELLASRAAAELDRLRSTRALRESERSLASMIANLPGTVYRCRNSPDWPMEFISDAVQSLTGYPPEAFRAGRVHFGSLFVPEDRERVWREVQQALDEKRRFQLTYRIRRADGEERILWEQGVGIYAPDGSLRFLEGFITDITEQRRAESAVLEHKERLAGIIDAAMDGIISVDEDQNILMFNPAAEAMFRCRAADAVGGPIDRFIPERFRADHPRHVAAFAAAGITNRRMGALGAVSGLRADGTEFPLEASISQVRVGGRRIFTVILRDITDRRRLDAIREQTEQVANIGGWELDFRTGDIYWSAGTHRIHETDPSTYKPELNAAIEFYAPEDRDEIRAAVERARQTGEPWDLELGFITAGGRRLWVRAVGRVAFDNGQAVRAFGAFQDITRRRQLQEETRIAQERLLELQKLETERVEAELAKAREQIIAQTRLATIGLVSASIAHELRNPLGAVRNAAYYLNQRFGGVDAKLREYLLIIDHEVAVSDKIIGDLMGMARGVAPQKVSVGLCDLVSEVCGIVRLPRGMSVHFTPAAQRSRVWADPMQLRQVLINLVMNAMQAMGGEGNIEVDAVSEGSYDFVSIRDEGPGVRAEDRARLFEPLFTTKAKGTGLGLAICRQIVELHGGTLDYVESQERGATFRIQLPRQPATSAGA